MRTNSSPENAHNKLYTNDSSQEAVESLSVTMITND